jgi:regulator of sirC expression with transglutaminase-like and TPR domain
MEYWLQAQESFQKAISYPDEEIDLAYAALCIAQAQRPDLDPSLYFQRLDTWAAQLQTQLPQERYPLKILKAVNQFLYQDLGFHGNTTNYYDPNNSFLDQVLERRTGIPITLALVYMEVAKRIGFPLEGVGMPGHFILRPAIKEMELYVDAFHEGEILFFQDCEARFQEIYGPEAVLKPTHLVPVSNSQFLARLLTNLKAIYLQRRDLTQALGAIEGILLLFPHWWGEQRDRGLILYELRRWEEARSILQSYVQANPEASDTIVIQQLLRQLDRRN